MPLGFASDKFGEGPIITNSQFYRPTTGVKEYIDTVLKEQSDDKQEDENKKGEDDKKENNKEGDSSDK